MTAATKANYSPREIPGGIRALGFVSMLMDVSSEMIQALLPVCPVTVLGTSIVTVDVTKGIAEATASIAKIFSAALSRCCRSRGSPNCTWTNFTGDC